MRRQSAALKRFLLANLYRHPKVMHTTGQAQRMVRDLFDAYLTDPGQMAPKFSRRAMAILVANLATHPLVWFFFSRLGLPRATFIVVAETWAFGFEVLAYRTIFPSASWKRCSLVSISANSASFLLGLLAIEWGFFRT